MSLITVAQLKQRLSEASADYDEVLAGIVAAVQSQFEHFCRRRLIVGAAAVTETYSVLGPYLWLKAYPVVAITSVKESWTYAFDDADALVADTHYRLMDGGQTGVLLRLHGNWCDQPDGVQVTYRGGYTAAGESPGPGETDIPDDLTEAALEQGIYLFQRKGRDIGLSGQSFEGGGFNKIETGDIVDSARRILLRNYGRPAV